MGGKARDWDSRHRLKTLQDAQAAKVQSVRQLAAKKKSTLPSKDASGQPDGQCPSGFGDALSVSLDPVYARNSDRENSLKLVEGKPLIAAVHDCMKDRQDRILQAWPSKPENAFVVAALSIVEGRLQGKLKHASVGVWPWRSSLTHAAKSILVEPDQLREAALATERDRRAGKTWMCNDVALEEFDILLLCLKNLQSKDKLTVRRPSLLETTPFFAPNEDAPRSKGRRPVYEASPDQFLNRIRKHTRIAEMGTDLVTGKLDKIGDPMLSPYAVFGLPTDARLLGACLSFPRFDQLGLDVVVADLARPARDLMAGKWQKHFASLLETVGRMGSVRPGVLVVTDDAFVAKKAEILMKAAARSSKPSRRFPQRLGLLLRSPSLLGQGADQIEQLAPIKWKVDFKDGSLVDLRNEFLSLARELEDSGLPEHAKAVKLALRFLRRVVGLPVGLAEARQIVSELHGSEDSGDAAIRDRYFQDGALAPLNHAIAEGGVFAQKLQRVHRNVVQRLDALSNSTPVALKLKSVLGAAADPADTLLVFPTKEECEIFREGKEWSDCCVPVIEASRLRLLLDGGTCTRMVMVQPDLDAIRTALLHQNTPPEVIVIGDASGARLIAGELQPLTDLAAFAQVHERARPLLSAVGRSEGDLAGDDPDLDIVIPKGFLDLDFTQGDDGNEAYSGAVVRIRTARGFNIQYRASANVPLMTPDEIRAFRREQAAKLRQGDSILVLSRPLMAVLREQMAKSTKTVEALRVYHTEVEDKARQLPGSSMSEKARHILRRIQEFSPDFDANEISNIRRWLAVGRDTIDDPAAMPFAPKTWRRFKLFADAIGIDEFRAKLYWGTAIQPTRAYRIREGLQFHERVVGFVIDPETPMATLSDADFASIWQTLIQNVDVIEHMEIINANAAPCAPCSAA